MAAPMIAMMLQRRSVSHSQSNSRVARRNNDRDPKAPIFGSKKKKPNDKTKPTSPLLATNQSDSLTTGESLKTNKSDADQLAKHITMATITSNASLHMINDDTIHHLDDDNKDDIQYDNDDDDDDEDDDDDDEASPGFPDIDNNAVTTLNLGRTVNNISSSSQAYRGLLAAEDRYYVYEDNRQLNKKYVDRRIRETLIWYQDIEKLLPASMFGQLEYFLLTLIFSSDLYYAFRHYNAFLRHKLTEHRIDDFFTSRRVLSIQRTLANEMLPSILWYKIVKYEPTPYKSMCYYQFIRQKDSDQIYKLPTAAGYCEMMLMCIITITFCLYVSADTYDVQIGRDFFSYNHMLNNELTFLMILSYILIFLSVFHLICILIVWGITIKLNIKIFDYKKKIYNYLSRRRKKEKKDLERLYNHNRKKIQEATKYRIYHTINPQSYLYYKRNGELYISLFKWLNLIEYEQNLDHILTHGTLIITFAMHKYFSLIIFAFFMILGVNMITIVMSVVFTISYWMHILLLYTVDYINHKPHRRSQRNCSTFLFILKFLFWPGILFFIVFGYCGYITIFHPKYFPVIWIGLLPMWLIIYSVFTRGYRRIYLFYGIGLFTLFFSTIFWWIFLNKSIISTNIISDIFIRWLAAICLIIFEFCYFISIQFEIHRSILFPQYCQEYKRDELAQTKFDNIYKNQLKQKQQDKAKDKADVSAFDLNDLDDNKLTVYGAKLYCFAQYAAQYFKKSNSNRIKRHQSLRNSLHFDDFSSDNNNIEWGFSAHDFPRTYLNSLWKKWYIQRPIEALKIPTPRFPFVYKENF